MLSSKDAALHAPGNVMLSKERSMASSDATNRELLEAGLRLALLSRRGQS
jgi:hypothetical protein